jgi:hypothetical protein
MQVEKHLPIDAFVTNVGEYGLADELRKSKKPGRRWFEGILLLVADDRQVGMS